MNAYKLSISGIFAVILAEDDQALVDKAFGHLNNARQAVEGVQGEVLATGTLTRLSDDEVVFNIEVYPDEVKLVPPSDSPSRSVQ